MASLDEVLNNATTVSFEPLPPATYVLEIESVEQGRSKPTAEAPQGNPKLWWKFVVVEGEHTGRVLFHQIATRIEAGRVANGQPAVADAD